MITLVNWKKIHLTFFPPTFRPDSSWIKFTWGWYETLGWHYSSQRIQLSTTMSSAFFIPRWLIKKLKDNLIGLVWSFIWTFGRSFPELFSTSVFWSCPLFPFKKAIQEINEDFWQLLGNLKNQSCLPSSRSAIHIPEPGNPDQFLTVWAD